MGKATAAAARGRKGAVAKGRVDVAAATNSTPGSGGGGAAVPSGSRSGGVHGNGRHAGAASSTRTCTGAPASMAGFPLDFSWWDAGGGSSLVSPPLMRPEAAHPAWDMNPHPPGGSS